MKKIYFPFTAIVGQEELLLRIILNIINPKPGGLLIKGVVTFNDNMIALQLTYFQDIDGEVFIQACMRHIAQSRFFLTISDILELCLEDEDHVPVDEIWTEFKNTTKDERDPLITEAFKLAGIDKGYCCNMTMDTAIRYAKPAVEKVYKHFLRKNKKNVVDNICKKALISYNKTKKIER